MRRDHSLVFDFAIVIIGIVIFLFGIYLVSFISMEVTASYIDILPMCLALWLVLKYLGVVKLIGKRVSCVFLLAIAFIALFNLFYSTSFVFIGHSKDIVSNHVEHQWAYECILTISKFTSHDWLSGAIADMHISKYANMFIYTSLIFRFGGNVPTHICIFNAFNLGLQALLMVLVANRLGVKERKQLIFVLLVCTFQPMFNALFAYGRDISGQASLALGFYVFARSQKNSVASIVSFPLYAFLFYSYRVQYTIIAIMLYFWSVFFGDSMGKRKTISILFGVFVTIILLVFIIGNTDLVRFFNDDLNVSSYDVVNERQGRSLINMLLIGIIGYFPWTNLFSDINWSFHIYACFQGAMNLTVLYFIVLSYKQRLKELLTNPALFAALMFLAFALYVPGHMAYTAVSMPFFAVAINSDYRRRFFVTFVGFILLVFVVGLAYYSFGFGGRSII